MRGDIFHDKFGVSQLNVKELKLELKERGLSLTGRKADLADC